MSLSLLELLEELRRHQQGRRETKFKEVAWEGLEKINDLLPNLLEEYNLLVGGLLDGIPIDSNCPVCCEEFESHEEGCAFATAMKLLKR